MYLLRLISFTWFLLILAVQLNGYQSSPQSASPVDLPPTEETVSNWETRLHAEADNLQLRGSLLVYYTSHGPVEKYFDQSLWFVQHHPEAQHAALSLNPKLGHVAQADQTLLKSGWEQAIIDHADSGKVLYHAGLFFSRQDPVRAGHLFEQARQLETENESILKAEANLYARAFAKPSSLYPAENISREDAQTLQAELLGGNDTALLAEVGSILVQLGQYGSDSSLKGKGTELINRAISLDPTNEKWKIAAERATNPPLSGGTGGSNGPVRLGARVAEANLIRKVDPVYPATAVPARISGIVEFTAIIGENGHVQSLQLVRGHPLFVNAAREAILQYAYKPTLLNGNPVPVITSIVVPFEFPAQ